MGSEMCRFEFSAVSEDYIQGACFAGPSASEDDLRRKGKRRNCLRIIDLCNGLTPMEFESLCARLLKLMRVENAKCTRFVHDHGVDFYGKVLLRELTNWRAVGAEADDQARVWFVGQAKHYQAVPVSTKEIRELVGAVELIRSGAHKDVSSSLSGLLVRVCDPVVSLFFTTGTFSRGARNLLTRTGVVGLDGSQIAMHLADHQIGVVGGVVDDDGFRQWVSG